MIIHANTFVPDYAENDPDYSPWVLTHEKDELLDPDIIKVLFEKFVGTYGTDGLMDTFYDHLSGIGYGTYCHSWQPIVLEVPSNEPSG